MDFSLNPEQAQLTTSIEKLAARRYSQETRRMLASSSPGYSDENWTALADVGVLGLTIPEAFGGFGLTPVETLLTMEILGRALTPEPVVSTSVIAARVLDQAGQSNLCGEMLATIVAGGARVAMAVLEDVEGYDLTQVATTVSRTADGYRLAGRKPMVIDGAGATHLIVTARLVPAEGGAGEVAVFLLSANQKGIGLEPYPAIDGRWLAALSLDDVDVAPANLIIEPDRALGIIERAIDFGVAALCAEALGAMAETIDLTRSHLATREQFGKPIGSFQALQHRFADMTVAFEKAKSATFMATAALQSHNDTERARATSAAKALVSRQSRFIVESTIQMHGGIGIASEFVLSQYVKRLLAIELTWGDRYSHEQRYSALMD